MKAEAISPGRAGRTSRGFLSTSLLILIGALLLLWPPVLNRAPFVLSDTTTYVRGADAAVFKLTGRQTDWTARFIKRYEKGQTSSAPGAQPSAAPSGRAVTLSGRSIYYGAFLYLTDVITGFWLAVLVQALVAAICIYLTVRRFNRSAEDVAAPFLGVTILLSVASSLAYFTGYLMPDVFTGLGILAAAHLLAGVPPLERSEKTFWFAILCWSALAHSSNILILLVLIVSMLVARLAWHAPRGRLVGLIAAGVAVGMAGEALFSVSVRLVSGDAPVRPPFVMARVIADGPGLDYLKRTCPGNGFALCNHMQGLSKYSDHILWYDSPNEGVFSAVGNDEKRRIAREEPRFVWEVFKDRPAAVLESSASAVWQQARTWHLEEFNTPAIAGADLDKLPPRIAAELAGSRAEQQSMPVGITEALGLAAMLSGLAVLLWALCRRATAPNIRIFTATLLIGIAADIIICGAMSTPHDRYSMRVLWLLPLGGFIVLLRRWRGSPNHAIA